MRATAPLVVDLPISLNGNLSGTERSDVPATDGDAEGARSLAKWKRFTPQALRFQRGQGRPLRHKRHPPRRGLDNLHSIYADQRNWE